MKKKKDQKIIFLLTAFFIGCFGGGLVAGKIIKHISPSSQARSAEEHKQFTIEKTPKENVWFCDTEGMGTPGYGLCMSAEDMAKIGLLCLNKGVYDGKRIVSSGWIEEMSRPRTIENQNWQGMEYGYLWCILDRKKKIYAALGNSGIFIFQTNCNGQSRFYQGIY